VAASPSLTLIKSFSYRGKAEEWGNTYHFSGGTPADDTHWKALADAWIASEKNCYSSETTVVRAYGHVPGTNHAIWTYDYALHSATVAGVLSAAGSEQASPGDCAGVLSWPTANYTSRGKRIYLRKFFHDVFNKGTTHEDELAATWAAGYSAFGDDVVTGFISGTYKICGPLGAAGGTKIVSPWVTTRSLKRRGRRP
jgi:hypothetical protein